MNTGHKLARMGLAALLLLMPCASFPQKPGPDSISVSAAPGLVMFSLPANGIANGSSPVGVTTTWQIQKGGTMVTVYAYFSNPAAALSDGAGSNIPSTRVSGSVNGGPVTPFTGAGPYSGGSLLVFSEQVRNNKRVTRTDNVGMQIDTTGLGLRPGRYSGVLHIQSFAM